MSGNISFNPMTTLNASNSFLVDTDGFVQGTYFDDPSMRYQLRGGIASSAITHPIWGGLPVTVAIPAIGANAMGPTINLATTIAAIAGWSVFNQAHHMILTPGNTVPLASAGMTVQFIEPGSLLRLAVQCDPVLADALSGDQQNVQVAWDFTNNRLTTYSSGTALPVLVEMVNLTSKIVNYNSSTGAVTWTDAGPAAIIRI